MRAVFVILLLACVGCVGTQGVALLEPMEEYYVYVEDFQTVRDDISNLCLRYNEFTIGLFDRQDSVYWENQAAIENLELNIDRLCRAADVW